MNEDNVAKLDKRIQNIWHALPRIADDLILISGTAAALHLGQRKSYDIDLITSQPLKHPRVIRKQALGETIAL